jgi:dTDP-4-dehydrorhamnose reductase
LQSDIDVIVNLVAATDVDRCEQDCEWAYSLNVESVKNVADFAKKTGVKSFIHISTDHVYDCVGPNVESNTNPINVYARTKLEGESYALAVGGVVLRTNFWGKSNLPKRSSFSDWLYSNLIIGRTLSVFDDVFFSPLHMQSLSKCVEIVAKVPRSGVYNLGMKTRVSKADFAFDFAEQSKLDLDLLRASSSEITNLFAVRPKDMSMDSSLFESTYSVILPDWKTELMRGSAEYSGVA